MTPHCEEALCLCGLSSLKKKKEGKISFNSRAALCFAYLWVLIKITAWINSQVHSNEDEDRTGK